MANMSQQELTANVHEMNAQVAQMLTALDEAMTLMRDLKAKSEGAWTKCDERINNHVTIAEVETKVESLTSNGNSVETRQMRLIDDGSINPPIFSGDRKKYKSWVTSMKAYLDSWYLGFRKMLNKGRT